MLAFEISNSYIVVNRLASIAWEHWSDTLEFITWSAEFWNTVGGLDCRVITTECISHVHWIHMYHLFCNALVYVIYSVVSGQYLYTISKLLITQKDIHALLSSGALTKGDRRAASGADLAEFNFDTLYGRNALRNMYTHICKVCNSCWYKRY